MCTFKPPKKLKLSSYETKMYDLAMPQSYTILTITRLNKIRLNIENKHYFIPLQPRAVDWTFKCSILRQCFAKITDWQIRFSSFAVLKITKYLLPWLNPNQSNWWSTVLWFSTLQSKLLCFLANWDQTSRSCNKMTFKHVLNQLAIC